MRRTVWDIEILGMVLAALDTGIHAARGAGRKGVSARVSAARIMICLHCTSC